MAAPPAAEPPSRVLVAGVGNVLRGDDGFGIAVVAELQEGLPAGVDVIETGIGGLGIVHQLMHGYDGLVIVDAVERGSTAGSVFVLVPQVPRVDTPTFDDWRAQLADLHLAEPSRVLRIARAAGVLPPRVLVVGCQPHSCEDFDEGLSRPVAAAVPVAVAHVRRLVDELLHNCRPDPCPGQGVAANDDRSARPTPSLEHPDVQRAHCTRCAAAPDATGLSECAPG